ncbi:MAG: OmpA family protein [Treponema sp.]|nr:OmpA family protein [Treponema sp.]
MAGSETKTAGRFFGVFFLLFMAGGILHAQVAAEMDGLLENPAINFAQASRFVLAASGAADEHIAAGAAFDLAREKGWLPKNAGPDSPVKLGELCFLVMKAFNIKGSFLYALFPGPRYAFRECEYLMLIPGRRDPAVRVSGEELFRMLDLVTAGEGAEPEPPVPAELPPVMTEREQIAGIIRAELEEHEVADTSVRIAEEGIVISLNNIQFKPDSVELTVEEMVKLREIAAILLRYPERRILVGGHTAMAGSGEGRLRISSERARSVADFLIRLNVRVAEEITVTGYGAARPLGDTATEAGRALNRRVEIILLDEVRP